MVLQMIGNHLGKVDYFMMVVTHPWFARDVYFQGKTPVFCWENPRSTPLLAVGCFFLKAEKTTSKLQLFVYMVLHLYAPLLVYYTIF